MCSPNGILPANGKGSCIHMQSGTLTLTGNPTIANIYTTSKTTLTVSGDFSGTASVTYSTAPSLGEEVGISDNARILGTLTCTNGDRLIKAEGEKLVVAINAPVVIVNGETETDYETLKDAIKEFEGGYIKLLKPLTEDVTVSKDITLDLNGYSITGTVTVEKGATLYGMDNETDDYTVEDNVYGTLTAAGLGQVAAQEGYLRVNQGGKLSFHRVSVSIDSMTLRPSVAGLYYKSIFLGDKVVAGAVEQFGVALSIYDIPDENNIEDLCQYTKFTEFQPGENGNATSSTLLKNILKTTNIGMINRRNLNTEVYGRPYLKTADGYVFGQCVTRDLAEQMKDVNAMMDTLSGSQQNALVEMYETYKSLLSGLSLNKIEDEINNETLRILMVGNSFCYYYVEELYGLLMANPDPNRGYTDVEIYNLYYSGCKLNQHYDWWKAGTANYELYKTDANGRKKQTSPTTGAVWSLEDALQQGRWDYLSLQGASGELNYVTGSVAANCASVVQYAEPLLDRFHVLYPKAQLLWHRTWAFEVGRISGSTIYDEESLAAYDAGMQAVCDYMCNEFDKDKDYDLMMVNSGAAWTIAREENAKLGTSLIPTQGGLCARKGIRNESTFPYYTGNSNAGDGYHDGDIGGGQFLNACVWYETLTGQSVLENTYKPTTANGTYELSDVFADLLRNAAHTALNKD